MKLKNLSLFNRGAIIIYCQVNHNVFVIKCDKSSFNIFCDIDLEVEEIVVSDYQDEVHVFTSYKVSAINAVNVTRLINRAFDSNLSVLDIHLNDITKSEFNDITKSEFKNFI